MAFKKESNEIMRKEYIKQKPGTIALGGETGHNSAMLELGHHREQGFFLESTDVQLMGTGSARVVVYT